MKDLIISSAMGYQPEDVACWINSIRDIEFDGDVVVLDFGLPNNTVKFLQDKGVTLYQCDLNRRHIVVERFITMYTFLCANEYHSVLATDIKDVIFQKNPFPVSDFEEIVVCWENINYEDEDWGDNNMKVSYPHMYDIMKPRPIYNAGVIWGKGDSIKDFFLHIFHLSLIGRDPQPDQAAMNILLWMFPFLGNVGMNNSSQLCANLGTSLADDRRERNASKLISPPPKIQDGVVFTDYDKECYIVHQYDRVAALKPLIQQQYGIKK